MELWQGLSFLDILFEYILSASFDTGSVEHG